MATRTLDCGRIDGIQLALVPGKKNIPYFLITKRNFPVKAGVEIARKYGGSYIMAEVGTDTVDENRELGITQ